jgi:Heavy metal binding domain
MILTKSTLASVLVVLGACARASATDGRAIEGAEPAPIAIVPTATGPSVNEPSSTPSASGTPARPPKPSTAKPAPARGREAAKTVYVCPMHPDVVSDKPGLCPKCNMKLDPKPQVAEVRPSASVEPPTSL